MRTHVDSKSGAIVGILSDDELEVRRTRLLNDGIESFSDCVANDELPEPNETSGWFGDR